MRALEGIVDLAFLLLGRVLKPLVLRHASRRRAVILSSMGGVGDHLLFTASVRGYRTLFPDKEIVLVMGRAIADLARNNPYLDRVITFDLSRIHRSLVEKFRLWYAMLSLPIDIAINIDYSTHAESISRTIMRWSFSKRRVAFRCLDRISRRNYSVYTEVAGQEDPWVFEIDRNNSLLHYLGLPDYRESETHIWGLDRHTVRSELGRRIPGQGYYVVFPGSAIPGKCWPAENFGQLIDALRTLHLVPVVCGGLHEAPIAAMIHRHSSEQVIDLTGQTTLMDLAAIIKGAKFVVSNDTSALHVAAAVHTPVFAIVGGGHYGRFVPYPGRADVIPILNEEYRICFRCYWDCIYDRFKCILETPVSHAAAVILTHFDELRGLS